MLDNPKLSQFLETYGIVVVVVVMMAAMAVIKPNVFLSAENLTNILKQNASLALLALGMLVVIVTGGIDLSVGSAMALAMVCIAMAAQAGVPWFLCLLVGPAVGLAVGWVNGIGLTKLHLPHPFIMTLGTLNIARGLTYLLTGGAPVSGLQPEVRYLGIAYWGLGIFDPPAGLPVSLIVVAVSAILVWLFLHRTATGRHIYAIGGNPRRRPVELDRPRARRHQPRRDPHEGRFSRAVFADHSDDFAPVQLEVDALQHRHVAEALGDFAEGEQSHRFSAGARGKAAAMSRHARAGRIPAASRALLWPSQFLPTNLRNILCKFICLSICAS